MIRPHESLDRKSGFTLAEILLAMLVFAIAISTILALLARSIETVDEILLKDEAMRLGGAVENFMEEMPFTEAYDLIHREIMSPDSVHVYAYFYRGEPGNSRDDGTLVPVSNPLENHVVVPGVRGGNDDLIDDDVAARESRIFRVKMEVSPANPFGDEDDLRDVPDPNAVVGGVPEYDSAVLVVFAEFYPVPSVGFPLTDESSPVYSYNFAVRR